MTNTDVDVSFREIWRLAWPQALMMLCHFTIGIVDVWAAGQIDSDVQASLGMINQLLFIFLILGIATANGAVAAISQSAGAQKPKRVKRFVGLVLGLGAVLACLIFVAVWVLTEPVMHLLQVPQELWDITAYFMSVYLLILPFYYLFVIGNAVFRAQKMVMIPLYAMAVTTLANTIGDLGLGLGWWGLPELGYRGLAWATFGSIALGACFNITVLVRTGLLCRTCIPPWRWIKRGLPYIVKVAWPAGLMQALWHGANMALYAVVASLPVGNVTALAAMTAGLRIESALFLPGFAFNLTASVLVGQFLGARRPDAAKRVGYKILGIGVGAISLLGVVLWIFVEPVTTAIAPEPAVAAEARDYLFYNIIAIPFTLTTMILAGALAGAGATLYNMVVFGAAAWLVRIPLAYLLGHVILKDADGVWLSQLTSMAVQAALCLLVFQFANWSRFAMSPKKKTGADNGLTVPARHPRVPG